MSILFKEFPVAATNLVMPASSNHDALFALWVEEHRGILVKIMRVYAPAPADAADLQQELLLQIWRALPSYSGQAKPSTWVYRVCLNTALTWRRGAERRERRFEPEVDFSCVPSGADTPADATAEREMLERLYAAIHALRDSDRALVLLSLDGLSYREISEVTGLSENHVGVALTHARKRLADLLKGVSNELQ